MEIATVVSKLKMYPYFDISNYILMCMMVRDDNHPSNTGKYRQVTPYNTLISRPYPGPKALSEIIVSKKHAISGWFCGSEQ